jgi:hypothetical protein
MGGSSCLLGMCAEMQVHVHIQGCGVACCSKAFTGHTLHADADNQRETFTCTHIRSRKGQDEDSAFPPIAQVNAHLSGHPNLLPGSLWLRMHRMYRRAAGHSCTPHTNSCQGEEEQLEVHDP